MNPGFVSGLVYAVSYDHPIPDASLIERLRQREGCWQWDEDGRDLSENIWNFGHRVEMHIDEATRGHFVHGVVLSGNFELVVDGYGPPTIMRPGLVYLLDPQVRHGAPGGSPEPIIVYVEQADPRKYDAESLYARAIAAAEALVISPQPDPEAI
ncbi:MAG: hypothetical protein ACXIVO_13860 [Glycocaulis sp.]